MSPFETHNFQRWLSPTGRPLMDDSNLLRFLGQVSFDSATDVFRTHLRGAVRQMIADVIAEEVTELCGGKHHPNESDCYRSGNRPGRVIYEGRRESVVRPRVRRRKDDGSSTKVTLSTYDAASDPSELKESIVLALTAGVSTRDVSKTQDRHWQTVGQKFVDQLRSPDLS